MTSLPEPLPQILPVQTKQAASPARGGDAEAARATEAPSRFSDRLRQQDTRSEAGAAQERHRPDTGKPVKPEPDETPTAAAPVAPDDAPVEDVAGQVTVPPALIVPVLILPDVILPDLGDLGLPGLVAAQADADAVTGTGEDPLLAALAKLLGPNQLAAQAVALAEVPVETIDTSLTQPLTIAPTSAMPTTIGTGGPETGLTLTLPLLGLPGTTTTTEGQAATATGIAGDLATIAPVAQQAQTGTDTGGAETPLPEAALVAPTPNERGATTFTAVLAHADEASAPLATATTVTDATPKAAAAEQRPTVPMANPMERAVAQQVSRALLREGADGLRLTLRLTPPELGTVRIEIVERAGVLQAHIHAEDDAVRVALERQLPQLRQDLRSHDAPVRDVHLGDAWSGEFTRQDRNQANGRGQGNRQRGGFSLDGAGPIARATPAASVLGATIAEDAVDARA